MESAETACASVYYAKVNFVPNAVITANNVVDLFAIFASVRADVQQQDAQLLLRCNMEAQIVFRAPSQLQIAIRSNVKTRIVQMLLKKECCVTCIALNVAFASFTSVKNVITIRKFVSFVSNVPWLQISS